MLASLLPGLRDLRTPLAVGYLWLLLAWLWFGSLLPKARPPGGGVVARLFDLLGLVGNGAAIAALSFTAYLIGSLVTLNIEARTLQRIIDIRFGPFLPDTRRTRVEFARKMNGVSEAIRRNSSELNPDEVIEAGRFQESSAGDIAMRLLAANQELFGHYDRLLAEASFRLNVAPPLALLGGTAAIAGLPWVAAVILLGALGLIYQGFVRGARANAVLQRAVVIGVVQHPAELVLRRLSTPRGGNP